MIKAITVFIVTCVLMGIAALLYYLGGEKGYNTKLRDLGVPTLASVWLISFFGIHWSYLLHFLLLFASLTTYHKWLNKFFGHNKDDVHWYGWLMTGFCYGLSALPLALHHSIGLAPLLLRTVVLTVFVWVWSEIQEDVTLEAGGRGAVIIATLPLLFIG